MKFSPGARKVRREQWPTSASPNFFKQNEAHAWCRAYPSDGLFYHHYTNTRWWFEKEEDAVAFALKWADK